MSANFYELLKYAKTGIASPDMTYYDKMRASTLMGGATVQTLTEIPPLTFKADGTPLISWSIKGNAVQNGTPTPDNPVMPEFVGVRTGNLFDKSQTTGIVPDTYINQNGELISNTYYYLSYPIKLTVGETYTWSFMSDTVKHSAPTVGFYDSEDHLLSVATHSSNIFHFSFTVPQGCAYIRASVYKREAVYTFDPMLISGTVEQADAVPLTWYEPFGWAEKITCAGQTVPVYLGQTQTVRRIKKVVFDGSEPWVHSGNIVYINNTDTERLSPLICTHLPNVQNTGMWNGNNWIFQVDISTLGMTGRDAWIAYLQQQYAAGTPVTVWYVLATPETAIVNEPLAKIGDYADELHSEDAAVTIPTVKGQNTLTVESDLPPSEMTIKYSS